MDELIFFGGEVKAMEDGRIEGHLVRFGNPDASAKRDVFTKADTDFDINPEQDESTIYYNHGFDEVLKKKALGNNKAAIGVDDVGVWIKAQLDMRDKYERAIYELAKAGKLGWSSGAPGHLVERKAIGDNAHLVTKWPLGKDASLTPIPADPMNRSSVKSIGDIEMLSLEDAIKSLLNQTDSEGQEEAESEAQERPEAEQSAVSATEAKNTPDAEAKTIIQIVGGSMADENQQTPTSQTILDERLKRLEEGEAKMAAFIKRVEESPRMFRSGFFTQDGGDADKAIKNVGDMLIAISRGDTKRLETVYEVKTQNTLEGDKGGFLIPETVLTALGLDISLVSPLASKVRRLPVPTPSGKAPVRNYRTVPGGAGASASASGVTSQSRKEGAAYTKETMLFESINYDTSDFASGYVKVTREEMRAVAMIESLLRGAIAEDVSNREEWAILQGSGTNEPKGVLNWDGKVEVTEDTDNTFAAADSDEMVSRLLEVGITNVAWAYHPGVYTQLAPFTRENVAVAGNRAQKISTVLHGYEHFKTQHLPNVGTDGYIVLGDWQKYVIFEWEGLYINFSEHRYADEGKVAWFFGKNIDGKPILPTKVTLADGTFTQSPFVVIKNKT